jgi:hypothetical protein
MNDSPFVRPERRRLFEEHQRLNSDHDLNAHIAAMLRDLYDPQTFSDRMARRSLLALIDEPLDA